MKKKRAVLVGKIEGRTPKRGGSKRVELRTRERAAGGPGEMQVGKKKTKNMVLRGGTKRGGSSWCSSGKKSSEYG